MSAPAPKPTTAPDEALSSLMGAALGTPNTARPDSISAPAYGSPADVVLRIRDYIGRHGRENTATLLLYEAMNALRRPDPAAAGDALPTIKGAAITGGYVVVTPAGWGADKATNVRDAILRLFPVNPAYTPRPPSAAQQGKGGAA